MTAGPLSALLLDGAAQDRPFAASGGHVIDLGCFRADVVAAAARLAAVSCRRGLVVCDDAYWAMVGLFALAHSGAETLFPANGRPATLSGLAGAYDHIVTDGAVQRLDRTLTLAPGDAGASTLPAMDADRARVTLFTSGSTGTPKRITKTIRQLEVEAETVERVLGRTVPKGAWVHATVLHQHLYGLTFRLCWPMATHRPFLGNVHHFWEPLLASLEADCVLVTSPSHLSRLGGLTPLPPDRRPSAVLSGGAPLPDDAADATRAVLGCAVREFFGSTEAGVVASRLRDGSEQPPWRPMPGVAVTRLDDGRMRVRSPYVGNPEDEVSGDLIEIDDDGGFRLKGRTDRLAKIEGIRIDLAECDARLAELEGVARAAVVVLGGNTAHLGGVVVLDAVGANQLAASGAFRLGRRLRSDLSSSLPSATLPRRWRFVPNFPTGPIGKINAADLAALFDAPQATAPQSDAMAPPKVEPAVLACRQTADGVELDLHVDSDLAPLAGHFPDLPIVPGVCLLDWVVRFSARYLAVLQDGATKIQIKFRHVLQPDCAVTLTLRRLPDRRVQFDYRTLATIYASGTVSADGA